jgi:Glutaredoxin-like domain (DUF836)
MADVPSPDSPLPDRLLPDLVLYGRADCALCDEARDLITALLADRRSRGLPAPALVERDIDADPAWQRAYFATIPVVELADRRIETTVSLAGLRRLLDEALDGALETEPSTA